MFTKSNNEKLFHEMGGGLFLFYDCNLGREIGDFPWDRYDSNRKPVRPKHFERVICCDIPGFTACFSLDSQYQCLNQSVPQIIALRLLKNPSI